MQEPSYTAGGKRAFPGMGRLERCNTRAQRNSGYISCPCCPSPYGGPERGSSLPAGPALCYLGVLKPMYLEHFKLTDLPFRLSPDPAYLYPSPIHTRAKAYM